MKEEKRKYGYILLLQSPGLILFEEVAVELQLVGHRLQTFIAVVFLLTVFIVPKHDVQKAAVTLWK